MHLSQQPSMAQRPETRQDTQRKGPCGVGRGQHGKGQGIVTESGEMTKHLIFSFTRRSRFKVNAEGISVEKGEQEEEVAKEGHRGENMKSVIHTYENITTFIFYTAKT